MIFPALLEMCRLRSKLCKDHDKQTIIKTDTGHASTSSNRSCKDLGDYMPTSRCIINAQEMGSMQEKKKKGGVLFRNLLFTASISLHMRGEITVCGPEKWFGHTSVWLYSDWNTSWRASYVGWYWWTLLPFRLIHIVTALISCHKLIFQCITDDMPKNKTGFFLVSSAHWHLCS